MSSSTLEAIIDVAHDLVGIKYYVMAAAAMIFYDYFLTLADEIKYAWHGRKSWVFAIFLAVLADGISVLVIVCGFYPRIPPTVVWLCDKTAFLSGLTFVFSTFLAQVVLTLRIYAVTSKNRIITACLGTITTSQFILGLYFTGYAEVHGAQQILLPLDAYRICILSRHRSLEIGFTTLSLAYDLTAFSLVVYLVLQSNRHQRHIPRLLGIIAQDATYYFLIIFTSHLVLELTLFFTRPTLQLLPAAGNVVYLPVMISRLLLSLKKASATQDATWSMGEPTVLTIKFAGYEGPPDRTDEMCMDTLASTHRGAQSRA